MTGSEAGRYRLVLLRHGQSEWNAANLFTGWVNVALTPEGEREAAGAGRLLADRGLLPDVVHTSLQRRAIRTADLALAACDRDWIPVRRSWRLNSNHYGALQGRNKAEVAREVGERQLMAWRRDYDAPPPPISPGAEHSQFTDAATPRCRPRRAR
jgi:2,3-bisphosphoglycerate-dependent phosphoglycerate mutase